MYLGFIAIGVDDPFTTPASEWSEVVNNQRAYAYARWASLTWVIPCDECEGLDMITSNGLGFQSPILDPAPWYDPDNPDSWNFLGVIGMEVTGASDSTRQANVTMGLSGIGIIGPTYMAPRTMTVRAIAIARDDCSLEYGILWLRRQYSTQVNPCGGDPMTFFDCCPCMCDETGGTAGPCWALNYEELANGPSECTPLFWPTTYAELITGPPAEDEEWCQWVQIYRDLREGPPPWTCCIEECLAPYMRQFHNARVVSGPTILRRPSMSCGAMAEIEFTIVAADPFPHSMPFGAVREFIGGDPGDELFTDADPLPVPADPFEQVA